MFWQKVRTKTRMRSPLLQTTGPVGIPLDLLEKVK